MKIDLVFGIDGNFAQHCAVTMASVFYNNREHDLTVHIIHDGLPDEIEKKLALLGGKFSQRICFYYLDSDSLPIPPTGVPRLSVATYFRLFMAELLPPEVNKAIYLDCDMIVRKDIAPLWTTDLEKYSLAAVEDCHSEGRATGLGYPEEYSYFSAGLLLINLRYWRENNVQQKLLDFIARHPEKLRFHDQDTLNAVRYESRLFVDITWNMITWFFYDPPEIREKYLERLKECIHDPAIVHIAGHKKAWQWVPDPIPFTDDYYFYIKFTPWGKFKRPKDPHRKGLLSRTWKKIKGIYHK